MISGDDDRLRVSFTGEHPGWVAYESAEVIASERALAVLPVAFDTGPMGARRLPGYVRNVIAVLHGPIGDRVLVNLDASPVAVLGVS